MLRCETTTATCRDERDIYQRRSGMSASGCRPFPVIVNNVSKRRDVKLNTSLNVKRAVICPQIASTCTIGRRTASSGRRPSPSRGPNAAPGSPARRGPGGPSAPLACRSYLTPRSHPWHKPPTLPATAPPLPPCWNTD
eukprot:480408-Prorocentrum_minimum.AAC.1